MRRHGLGYISFLVGLGLLASAFLTATASPATRRAMSAVERQLDRHPRSSTRPSTTTSTAGGSRRPRARCSLGYPDKRGPASARLYARGRARVPEGDERRPDVHVHDPARLPLLRRDGGDRGELYARAFERALEPEDRSRLPPRSSATS